MKNLSYNVEVNGKKYSLTGQNHLVDMDAWDTDILNWLAEKAGIRLSEEHLAAIKYIRETYESRERHPVVRLVADFLGRQFGPEKGSPRFFYSLFPKGVSQASALAGLPFKELCF